MSTYVPLPHPAPHTCWDEPTWDGTMQDGCPGCDQAAATPCRHCGYGRVFTTHSDLSHAEDGDTEIPEGPPSSWTDAPHIYQDPS